jgi:hypothetical protein
MPYKIIKARGKKDGYYVKNLESGHKFSNTPIPYDQALKQLAVLQLRKRGVPPLSKGRKSSPKRRRSTRKSSPKRRRSTRRYSMTCGASY